MLSAGDYPDSGVGSDPDRECRDVCEDESDTENGGSPPGARKTSTSEPPLMNGECIVSYLRNCSNKILHIYSSNEVRAEVPTVAVAVKRSLLVWGGGLHWI